jgi:acetyl esterase/lipase
MLARRDLLGGATAALAGIAKSDPLSEAAAAGLGRAAIERHFERLPAQPSINPRADAYAISALRLSCLAAMGSNCLLDIRYGRGEAQRLDIYMPTRRSSASIPVFINLHGGGWTAGRKEWMGLNAPPIVAAPAIYVSVEYSLAPDARFPTQLHDCVEALAWVYRNIADYGGDRRRLHIGGHSAGGHLAALVTLRADLLAQAGLPGDVVKSCFPYSGIYDLRDPELYGLPATNASATLLLASNADAGAASPMRLAVGNRTPFFISWGENDSAICRAQGPAFAVALRRGSARVEARMYPLFDHFWVHLDQQRPESDWCRTLLAWMGTATPSA